MYGDYIKEHHSDEIIENQWGFATFRYLNDGQSVYIVDLYVVPRERQNGVATRLADEVVLEAKKKGARELLGSVVPKANGSTESLKILLSYGMRLVAASENMIVLSKGI